jgi:hypothetical protein
MASVPKSEVHGQPSETKLDSDVSEQTGETKTEAHIKQPIEKVTFTVFCWNIHNNTGNAEYRKAAVKRELTPCKDLVFLQEMKFLPNEAGQNYIPFNLGYGVVYVKEEVESTSCNGILYNTKKFHELPGTTTILTEAYFRLQLQVDCCKMVEKGGMSQQDIKKILQEKYVGTKGDIEKAAKDIQYGEVKTADIFVNIQSAITGAGSMSIVEGLSTDTQLQKEVNCLKDCFDCPEEMPGPAFWNTILPDLRSRFALTCLAYEEDNEDVIIAVSFHNHTKNSSEMLHVLLYLLREFRELMKAHYQGIRFHILLAGDFNTDIFFYNPDTGKQEPKDHLLKAYNPQPCQPTGRRREEIDYILLWSDKWELGTVQPRIINKPEGVDYWTQYDPSWKRVNPNYTKDPELVELFERLTFADQVSNHDPLEAKVKINDPYSLT